MKRKVLPITLVLLSMQAIAGVVPANKDGSIGPYDADAFVLAQGPCNDCRTIPQALWYFEKELIGVPRPDMPISGFSPVNNAQQDLAQAMDTNALPGLIWLGSSQVIQKAHINADARQITLIDGEVLGFDIVPKIPANLSYWDESTVEFFRQRPVRLRGELQDAKFTARTVWPADYKINVDAQFKPLAKNETLKSLVEFENGGARSAYESRLLWEKSPGAAKQTSGKSAIALMLNGAQGDDDEAHGGHFAVATGRMEADGSYARWLVNNFYDLASNSEKGIIAGITPMDKYLADLNNGQGFYRPSYMLVAVLKNQHAALRYQASVNRVYNHFYRNDFVFDLSRNNCTGITIDTVRTLGWNVPAQGIESQFKATAAYFYVAATEKSLTKGRAIYDYLNTETTRLLPAVAFDGMGNDLLDRIIHPANNKLKGVLEEEIAQDIEAIYFVRIPQIPSSRAFGLAPVYSFDQYMKQAPADRSQWKIVPTTPNPLPENLKDGLALNLERPSLVPWPVAMLILLFGILVLWITIKMTRKIFNKKGIP